MSASRVAAMVALVIALAGCPSGVPVERAYDEARYRVFPHSTTCIAADGEDVRPLNPFVLNWVLMHPAMPFRRLAETSDDVDELARAMATVQGDVNKSLRNGTCPQVLAPGGGAALYTHIDARVLQVVWYLWGTPDRGQAGTVVHHRVLFDFRNLPEAFELDAELTEGEIARAVLVTDDSL